MEFVVADGDALHPAASLEQALALIENLRGDAEPRLYRTEPVPVRIRVEYRAELADQPGVPDEANADGASAVPPPLPTPLHHELPAEASTTDPHGVAPLSVELPMTPVPERSGFSIFGS